MALAQSSGGNVSLSMSARTAFADPANATRRLTLIFAASLLLLSTVFCLVVSLSTPQTYPVQNTP